MKLADDSNRGRKLSQDDVYWAFRFLGHIDGIAESIIVDDKVFYWEKKKQRTKNAR